MLVAGPSFGLSREGVDVAIVWPQVLLRSGGVQRERRDSSGLDGSALDTPLQFQYSTESVPSPAFTVLYGLVPNRYCLLTVHATLGRRQNLRGPLWAEYIEA